MKRRGALIHLWLALSLGACGASYSPPQPMSNSTAGGTTFEQSLAEYKKLKFEADQATEAKRQTEYSYNQSVGRRKIAVDQLGRMPVNAKEVVDRWFDKNLIDPYSRHVQYTGAVGNWAICGRINSKNRFGAYTGSQAFFALFDSRGRLRYVFPEDDQMFAFVATDTTDIEYEPHEITRMCGFYRGLN